jgi:hypothetical protein
LQITLLFREVQTVTGHCAAGRSQIAGRDGDLPGGRFKRGLIDGELLLIDATIHPRQHGACCDGFAFVEGQLGDGRLHVGETQHTLMRFDISADHDVVGRRARAKHPTMRRRPNPHQQRCNDQRCDQPSPDKTTAAHDETSRRKRTEECSV